MLIFIKQIQNAILFIRLYGTVTNVIIDGEKRWR